MKHIVVGLDGSPRAPDVLRVAIDQARNRGTKLVVVRVVSWIPELPEGMRGASPEDVADAELRKLEEFVEGQGASSLVEKYVCRIGAPWRVLCEVAREEGSELLVVGTHGYSGVDHVIGTTAARVVNHAHCSVLVARTPS
jgi:nucleotide-binding universal stress UspA family protein